MLSSICLSILYGAKVVFFPKTSKKSRKKVCCINACSGQVLRKSRSFKTNKPFFQTE